MVFIRPKALKAHTQSKNIWFKIQMPFSAFGEHETQADCGCGRIEVREMMFTAKVFWLTGWY